jgi:hypothetical protein
MPYRRTQPPYRRRHEHRMRQEHRPYRRTQQPYTRRQEQRPYRRR